MTDIKKIIKMKKEFNQIDFAEVYFKRNFER